MKFEGPSSTKNLKNIDHTNKKRKIPPALLAILTLELATFETIFVYSAMAEILSEANYSTIEFLGESEKKLTFVQLMSIYDRNVSLRLSDI